MLPIVLLISRSRHYWALTIARQIVSASLLNICSDKRCRSLLQVHSNSCNIRLKKKPTPLIHIDITFVRAWVCSVLLMTDPSSRTDHLVYIAATPTAFNDSDTTSVCLCVSRHDHSCTQHTLFTSTPSSNYVHYVTAKKLFPLRYSGKTDQRT